MNADLEQQPNTTSQTKFFKLLLWRGIGHNKRQTMKVTRNMIDRQLRFRATLLGWAMRNFTEEGLRKKAGKPSLVQKFIRVLMRPKNVTISERWIPREDGTKLRILVITPHTPKQYATGLLWIHGGGYFGGSSDDEAGASESYVNDYDCVIVSPDYRLSVAAPYPAALEDCYTALRWLKDNAEELSVRSDQIAVAGGSAGGGLTAALTMYARDKGEINIAFQMPICPMLDDRMETDSARDNDAPFWDTKNNQLGWKLYLGHLYGSDDVPPYAAPARATNFSNLPPTFTYVGSIEPFRDETVTYAEKLRAAGVAVEYQIFEGGYHGFDAINPNAEVSKQATEFRKRWLKKAIREYFAPQPGIPVSSGRI
jgi:acetyl esterase/lipase